MWIWLVHHCTHERGLEKEMVVGLRSGEVVAEVGCGAYGHDEVWRIPGSQGAFAVARKRHPGNFPGEQNTKDASPFPFSASRTPLTVRSISLRIDCTRDFFTPFFFCALYWEKEWCPLLPRQSYNGAWGRVP